MNLEVSSLHHNLYTNLCLIQNTLYSCCDNITYWGLRKIQMHMFHISCWPFLYKSGKLDGSSSFLSSRTSQLHMKDIDLQWHLNMSNNLHDSSNYQSLMKKLLDMSCIHLLKVRCMFNNWRDSNSSRNLGFFLLGKSNIG